MIGDADAASEPRRGPTDDIIDAARETGDVVALAELLVQRAEAVPIFHGNAEEVLRWLSDPVAFSADARVIPTALEARRSARRAPALVRAGQFDAAVIAARLALVLATEAEDARLVRHCRVTLALVLARAGADVQEAVQLARVADIEAASLTDRVEARALKAAARTAQGDLALNAELWPETRGRLEEALELLGTDADARDDERWHVLTALSGVHQKEGNLVRALNRLRVAQTLAERHGADRELLENRFTTANLLTTFNRYDEALQQLDLAADVAARNAGLALFDVPLAVLKTTVLTCLGRLDEAKPIGEWVLETTLERGDTMGHVQGAAVLSAVHQARGDAREGYRVLSFAAGRLEVGGEPDAGQLVRRMVGALRDRLGHAEFDAMAEAMYQEELLKRRLRGER